MEPSTSLLQFSLWFGRGCHSFLLVHRDGSEGDECSTARRKLMFDGCDDKMWPVSIGGSVSLTFLVDAQSVF